MGASESTLSQIGHHQTADLNEDRWRSDGGAAHRIKLGQPPTAVLPFAVAPPPTSRDEAPSQEPGRTTLFRRGAKGYSIGNSRTSPMASLRATDWFLCSRYEPTTTTPQNRKPTGRVYWNLEIPTALDLLVLSTVWFRW